MLSGNSIRIRVRHEEMKDPILKAFQEILEDKGNLIIIRRNSWDIRIEE